MSVEQKTEAPRKTGEFWVSIPYDPILEDNVSFASCVKEDCRRRLTECLIDIFSDGRLYTVEIAEFYDKGEPFQIERNTYQLKAVVTLLKADAAQVGEHVHERAFPRGSPCEVVIEEFPHGREKKVFKHNGRCYQRVQ